MDTEQKIYIPQGIDYLGFLNAKLRDLRGWSTLLNELIQNADDAVGATQIILDITDDALVVENDGAFTDCGAVHEPNCALDPLGDGRKICDFHAFRRVASGHKRLEENTTGAFGIGFISVYQITDCPRLRSGNWLWVLRPDQQENQRIEATSQEVFLGTRFALPWARGASTLRSRLGVQPVPTDVVDQISREFIDALPSTAPFLKRLRLLEVRRQGNTEIVVRCDPYETTNQILTVSAAGQRQRWKRLMADFAADAQKLRKRYGSSLEAKRKVEVTVAVPIDGLSSNGRLYASLPTDDQIDLPLLINADFFPSSDRKRILFDRDYQGEWNRAAIKAAARALASGITSLKGLIKPAELWMLVEASKELHVLASKGMRDEVFATFWNEIAPIMHNSEFIFSSRNIWSIPSDIRLLQNAKDEASVLPFLEAVGLKIVHFDLQRFSNLLREVGVSSLTLDDLSNAMIAAGLNRFIRLEEAPIWLQAPANREQLGLEIERLLQRTAKETKRAATAKISACALILTMDGSLAPPSKVRTADPPTREIFNELTTPDYWASDSNPEELLRLVSPFSLKASTELLRDAGADRLHQILARNPGWIHQVIRWFADKGAEIARSSTLQNELRSLSIWPSAGRLCLLTELSVPGDFDDLLKLAKIIDADISKNFHSFLTNDLQAQRLTVNNYLAEHVPRAFAREPLPTVETRRALVQLMIEHAGVLLDDSKLTVALSKLPIVECTDGSFRTPLEAYLDSELIREILPEDTPIAVIPSYAVNAGKDLFKWLGVHEMPQAKDVLRHIDVLTKNNPDGATRERVKALFKGLAENWQAMRGQHKALEELRRMQWLPGESSNDWLSPKKVFAAFRKYLFHSQAVFLDIPIAIQQRSQLFLEFLGVEDNPTVLHVANHLLQMVKEDKEVSVAVYDFLNQNSSAREIHLLKGKKCLRLESGAYADPSMAYWGNHPFGKYRIKLSSEWRRFGSLLEQLGTTDEPGMMDGIGVLQEISEKYRDNRVLDDDDYAVVMDCWTFLSRCVNDDDLLWACQLVGRKVIPNANHYLMQPSEVFFEDRPGLVDEFDPILRSYIIPRPEVAWWAMSLVGVKPLSSVVSIQLIDCSDPSIDHPATERLHERWLLMRRIFASISSVEGQDKVLSPPELWGSDKLVVLYRMLKLSGQPKEVASYLNEDKSRLYFRRDRSNIEGSIARELAFGLFPDSPTGALAAAIKEVLLASNIAEASLALDDLGFAKIDLARGPADKPEEVGIGAQTEGIVNSGTQHEPKTAVQGEIESETFGESNGQDDVEAAREHESNTNEPRKSNAEAPANSHSIRSSSNNQPNRKHADKTPRPKSPRAMLRSYVINADPENAKEMSEEAKQHRDQIDSAGIERALVYEREGKRHPTKMPHENEGYDIESRNDAGEIVRFIEVKSISGPWDGFGIGLSAPEFRHAQEKRNLYWLYVVENVSSPEPILHAIQHPASKVVEFRFDEGWQLAAESTVALRTRSLRDVIKQRLQPEEDEPESGDEEDPRV